MKTINLDLYKIDGMNKAFTSRVADTGDTLKVIIESQGSLFDLSNATKATLKVIQPNNNYLWVDGAIKPDGVEFVIPSGFNSIKGYFKDAYVEITTPDKLYTTQSFMYYSYGDADISGGNAGDYISRVEELIAELNKKVDAMLSETQTKIDGALSDIAELQAQLQAFLDKFESSKPLFFRGSLPDVDWNTFAKDEHNGIYYVNGVKASEDKHTPVTTGQIWGQLTVKYQGIVIQEYTNGRNLYMRIYSGSPLTWSNWRKVIIEGDVYSNTEIDTKLANITVDAYTKTQTDQKLTEVKNTIPDEAQLSDVNSGIASDMYISPKVFAEFQQASRYIGYFGAGEATENPTDEYSNVKYPAPIKEINSQNRPFTLNADGTFTMTRDATLLISGSATVVGGTDNTTASPFCYLYFSKPANGTTQFISWGSTRAVNGTLNYNWSSQSQKIISFTQGQVLQTTARIGVGKTVRSVAWNAITIEDITNL